jgi:hypothetical protein
MALEGSLLCSQKPATGPYHKLDASSPHPLTLFPYSPSTFLKPKSVAHSFWILLVYRHLQCQSENTLFLIYIITSQSVPQPDVSAANAICRNTDIFNKDCFSPTNILNSSDLLLNV